MKALYILFIATCTGLAVMSCHDEKVGFLVTDIAEYAPDSIVIKAQLDPVVDQDRLKFKYPWITAPIEGIDGTKPMQFAISGVSSTDGGDTLALASVITIAQSGAMSVPWNHTVPAGHYDISIRISNEGYANTLRNIYTVVIK